MRNRIVRIVIYIILLIKKRENSIYGENGLLLEEKSELGQKVINLLFSIPERKNGQAFHQEIDKLIDQLTFKQAVYVIHRIEGAGFGQLSYAGIDSPESHQSFIENQVNRRFNGSIYDLLKTWGTLAYSGY